MCNSGNLSFGQNPMPNVKSGRIIRMNKFVSKYIAPRNIDIWLPDGYSDKESYDVLYMNDGQMLFDPEITWNHQAWNVDDVASRLMSEAKVRKFIIVGIWNNGNERKSEYFPQKPYKMLSPAEKDSVNSYIEKTEKTKAPFNPKSDNYLKFIVKELKPLIDRKYSVNTKKENTFIAGSSMGGLISIYALCEYPKTFGGAICMSTHWVGIMKENENPIPNSFIQYLNKKLPNNHKIYFDCGDQSLDAMYPAIQNRIDSVMTAKGFNKTSWSTQYFPGEDHSENSWSKRLNIPLEFMFKMQ